MNTFENLIFNVVLFGGVAFLLINIINYLSEKYFTMGLSLSFLKHTLKGLIYSFLFMSFLTNTTLLQPVVYPFLASSGAIGFIGGIASQQIFSNILGGLFISLTRPFIIGDNIEIVEEKIGGIVEDITLRHVIMRSYDKKEFIIPNAKFNNLTIKKLTQKGS